MLTLGEPSFPPSPSLSASFFSGSSFSSSSSVSFSSSRSCCVFSFHFVLQVVILEGVQSRINDPWH